MVQTWAVTDLRSHNLLMAELKEEAGAPESHVDFFHHDFLNISLPEIIPKCTSLSIRNLLSVYLFGSHLCFQVGRGVFVHHWQNRLAFDLASMDSCGFFLALPRD